MCGYCNTYYNKDDDFINPFDQKDKDGLVDGVFQKVIHIGNLPKNIYQKTAGKLAEGVFKGYGKNMMEVVFESPDYAMLLDLTENIYMFSAAKTYQQVRMVTDLLTIQEYKTNFYKFKKAAGEIFEEYNVNYLKAEYNTAIGSSRMAAYWQQISEEEDVLESLQYETVGDARVRPTHKSLDNIVRPVEDKFWDNYFPPNGWNCRCTVKQVTDEDKTNLRGFKRPNDVPLEFMMNSGKDRIVFSPKHPYFKVAKGDKALAERNFNLPLPERKNKL